MSTIYRNIGKLVSANVIAQALGILAYPILTRVYSADDFGLLSLFTSIASIMALIATAEYQYAIVLPKEEQKSCALVHICLLFLLVTVSVLCLSIPFSSVIANIFKAPELARWWWLMPICVLSMGLWNILNYLFIRHSAFTRISGYQISQSIFSVTGKIGLGALGWLQGGMILATVFAPLFSLMISAGLSWKKHLQQLLIFRRCEVRQAMRQYANFPKFNLPRALVNSAGQSLPIWLLTPYFGLEAVGHLSLALMAAFVPLNIIARACYQVLFQQVSELVQKKQSIRPVLLQFCMWMALAMAVGMAIVYIFVPQLVTLLFGAEWIESATLIRRLFPYLLLVPLCGSICFLSDVFAKQKIAMWMETGYVAAMAIALCIGIKTQNFDIAVSTYGWVGGAYLCIQLGWFRQLVRRYEQTL